MALTARRKQFLENLVKLYGRTRLPVHYSVVAKSLGVSKFTAYDILLELEKAGLLRRAYALGRGRRGRARVAFSPTQRAVRLFQRMLGETGRPAEWQQIKNRVQSLLAPGESGQPGDRMRSIVAEITRAQTPLAFCADALALLVCMVKGLGERTVRTAQRLLDSPSEAEVGLAIFAGTVLGGVLKAVGSEISSDLVEYAERFQRYLSELDTREQAALVELVSSALSAEGA